MPRSPRLSTAERRARANRISAKYGISDSKSTQKRVRWDKANLRRTRSGKLVHLNKAQLLERQHAAKRAIIARQERKSSYRPTPEEARRYLEDEKWLLGEKPKRPEADTTRNLTIIRQFLLDEAIKKHGSRSPEAAAAKKQLDELREAPKRPETENSLQSKVLTTLKNLKDTKAAFGSGTVLAKRAEDDYNEALGKLKAFKNRRKR